MSFDSVVVVDMSFDSVVVVAMSFDSVVVVDMSFDSVVVVDMSFDKCGCGGYVLTRVTNEQVVSVYCLLNVDGCLHRDWGAGHGRSRLEKGAWEGWVRRQTQFGVVVVESIHHLLLYLNG